MADGYRRQRVWYQDASGGLAVTLLTNPTTLAVVRSTQAIYVQRVHVQVTSPLAGTTWTIQDSAGVVVVAAQSVAVAGGFDFDFGAFGMPLTVGASLVLVPSAGGAAGAVTWEAYQRPLPNTAILP